MKNVRRNAAVGMSIGVLVGPVGLLIWGFLGHWLVAMMLGSGCLAPLVAALGGAVLGAIAGAILGALFGELGELVR